MSTNHNLRQQVDQFCLLTSLRQRPAKSYCRSIWNNFIKFSSFIGIVLSLKSLYLLFECSLKNTPCSEYKSQSLEINYKFLQTFGSIILLHIFLSIFVWTRPNKVKRCKNSTPKFSSGNTSDNHKLASSNIVAGHRGTLYLRIGPMFSSKTTWLNGELTQMADKGFLVAKITHDDDVRNDVASCDNSGSTHNSSYKSLSSKITVIRASELRNVDIDQFHVVGVDESQFFPDLVDVIESWVEKKGKHVRVAGLDGDAFKRKFGQTLDLIPMCDEVVKLSASCKLCLEQLESTQFMGNILSIVGPFTKRLGQCDEQKLVGGSDSYIPVCRYHHSQ